MVHSTQVQPNSAHMDALSSTEETSVASPIIVDDVGVMDSVVDDGIKQKEVDEEMKNEERKETKEEEESDKEDDLATRTPGNNQSKEEDADDDDVIVEAEDDDGIDDVITVAKTEEDDIIDEEENVVEKTNEATHQKAPDVVIDDGIGIEQKEEEERKETKPTVPPVDEEEENEGPPAAADVIVDIVVDSIVEDQTPCELSVRGLADLNRMSVSFASKDKEGIQMKALGETSSLKDNQLTRDQRSGTVESGGSDDLRDASVVPVESSYALFFQVVFPFTIAGVGMVFAGIVLDYVQHWELFEEVPEVFILVPALLGLKGNLEMTLASRLSTLANLGELETPQQQRSVISANMALIQVQATVVAFLASAFAMLLAWIPNGEFDGSHAALLCASALATACTASFLLSLLMSAVVIASRAAGINPDNVATPIAASLGDLTTLGVLSLFGSLFLHAHQNEGWLNLCIIIFFIVLAPVWLRIAMRDEGATQVLRHGWSPVIFSMLISSGGGFILKRAVEQYPKIASFQPVINGVGGNLVAVQASRLSTAYHQMGRLGELPNGWTVRRFTSFTRAFFSKEWDSRSARVLLFLVVPGHMFFNWLIRLFHFSAVVPPSGALFTSFYLFAALSQVIVLLYVCQWLVSFTWASGIDPDNAAIPYLTALGDLLGTAFLFITFHAVDSIEPTLV